MRLCNLVMILSCLGITRANLEVTQLESSQLSCYCNSCNQQQTVGILYNGTCYFVEKGRTVYPNTSGSGRTVNHNTTGVSLYHMNFRFSCDSKNVNDFLTCAIPDYSEEWKRIDRVLKEQYRHNFCDMVQRNTYGTTLDILHRLTREVYKKQGTKAIRVSFHLNRGDFKIKKATSQLLPHDMMMTHYKKNLKQFLPRTKDHLKQKFLKTMLRLPSKPLAELRNPAYDIERNIIFDDYGSSSQLERIFATKRFIFMTNEFQKFNPVVEQYNLTVDEGCRLMNIYEVDTREKYEMMTDFLFSMNVTIFERIVFLFKFDPTKVQLDNSDYFMHVQTYTHLKSPAGYHILDFGKGKIFQQPDHETALKVLKMDLDTYGIPMLCETVQNM